MGSDLELCIARQGELNDRVDGQGMVMFMRMGSQRDTFRFEMFGHCSSEELDVG